MIDATQGHSHAHDHLIVRAQDYGRSASRAGATARPSLVEASAAGRLFGVSFVIAALWAGVYWALH
ncbi:MAG: hypothetical protein ACR650_06260 [Methylocystis sp.]|jgi:hypothetical protein